MFNLLRSEVDTSMIENVHVVHGLPIGTGGVVLGKRYWHAWVEFRMFDIDFVCDRSTDPQRQSEVSRWYYEAGTLDEEHVWRFTPEQALQEMMDREHYGPWVDGWEDLAEI